MPLLPPPLSPESAVRQLAASILSREITPALLATLQEPSTAGVLSQLEPSCEKILKKTWSENDFEEAAVEYCRLFILNPAVPARAAAYFEGQSLEIAGRIQFMLDNGFLELPETFQSLAPDHIALLLVTQTSMNDEDGAQFHKDNLKPWLSRFAADLEASTTHPLYQLAAKLVQI